MEWQIKKFVCILFFSTVLSACSLFPPLKTSPNTIYALDTVPAPLTKKPMRRIDILVAKPETNAIYNTTQMIYTKKPHQIAYFSINHWANTPANMLQPLIVQTLQKTHYFHAVAAAPAAGNYPYLINTQILQLQQTFFSSDKMSRVEFKLQAQLINTMDGKIIAAKQFSASATAPEETPYGGVIAANAATAAVLNQLARFCVQHL